MNIATKTFKGRRFVYGSGTPDEIESLDVEKDFEHVLDSLYAIKRSVYYLFDIEDSMKVNRKVYGTRKAVRE